MNLSHQTLRAIPAIAAAIFGLAPTHAVAQGALDAPPKSGEMLTVLLGLFVVATVLESALATLFQWRPFRELFNGKAVKTVIMTAAGLIVVVGFDYDVFATLMGKAGAVGESGPASVGLSALILAGGSAAVNKLFQNLHILVFFYISTH